MRGLPASAFDPISGAATVVWFEVLGPERERVPVSQLGSVLRSASRSPDATPAPDGDGGRRTAGRERRYACP
ncbi:MAG TPA: hypothetical protein VF526_10090 [Solirubrobacteraceae bacterium]